MQHQQADPFDETIASSEKGPAKQAIKPRLGSTPDFSDATHDLLRRRLRYATLLMFAGFGAFFVWRLFRISYHTTPLHWTSFGLHAAMTAITGMIALRLCANCVHVLRHLRACELVVFGGSSAFFVVLSYSTLTHANPNGYILPIVHIWLMQLFMYALFIPNTLKRAAIIIGCMAAAPAVLMIVVALTNDGFAEVLESNPDYSGLIIETIMLMALAAVSAVWGASTIGNLRREVLKAEQLGQYRLKQRIGKGGMGDVYLAEHMLLKRPCAIKLIRPDKAGDAKVLARFEREVQATAKLTHLNTIEIYDYGRSDDGTFYYVMEYLPGMNLAQLVAMHGALPAGRMIHLLTQTCEALSEAHRQGLIHRDIKPANIFAAHRGGVFDVAKLLDFGLVKPLTHFGDGGVTVEGSIMGSPLFMSPEQVTGDTDVDARSDIYSLGVVAYYLLTGTPPFDQASPMKIMLAHASERPLPLTEHAAGISEELQQVVLRCLEKDIEHRFQDVETLRQALLDCPEAGTWAREDAAAWWQDYGCPKKKALDSAALQEVYV